MTDEELFEWLEQCPHPHWFLSTDGNGTITITLTEKAEELEND